jgi:7-cyano-7-deazaguanine synthase in queuosine biosynthesis
LIVILAGMTRKALTAGIAITSIAHAGALAAVLDCRTLVLGLSKTDLGEWHYTEFFKSVTTLIKLGLKKDLQIVPIWQEYEKKQIVSTICREIEETYPNYKVPLAQTWSCYYGGVAPCGECPGCKERKAAEAPER